MTIQTASKKRKHDESSQHSDNDHQPMSDSDKNIESVLFDEMTSVNSQLISLASKVKLVDTRYFMYNSIMIDEFIDNIHEFLKQVDIHRKKVSSKALNSDNLFNVFQFLDINTLISNCRCVSTMWKEVTDKIDLNLTVGRNIEKLVTSPSIQSVTSLKLSNAVVSSYRALAKKDVDLTKLKSLDVSGQNLIMSSVKHLTKCKMPNLTELDLSEMTNFNKEEAEVLFKSKLFKSIKKLDISKNDNIMEACQHVNQITHLTYQNYFSYHPDTSFEPLVKDKKDLEYLSIHCLKYASILTSGVYTKLSCLKLYSCDISNEEFVSLIVCKNLPSLRTVVFDGQYTESELLKDSTVVNFPANSQSSITDLTLRNFDIEPFPTLIDHCPNLKSLSITTANNILLNYLNSNSLSNLKSLRITCRDEALKIIFSSPIFSNLKELWMERRSRFDQFDVDLLLNCTNLENLRKLRTDYGIYKECCESLKTHPIFSKVMFINDEYSED